jgi:hypothetical protein
MEANFVQENLTVPKATILGKAEEVSEPLVEKINANSDFPTRPSRKKENEALYQKLLQNKLDHLSQEDRQILEPILLKYSHIFHDKATNDFKGTSVIEHQIPVGNM